MNLSFENQVALVTGGDSGIGWATAKAFAEAGAAVVLAANREEKLRPRAAELESAGHQVLAVPCDVSIGNQVKEMAELMRQVPIVRLGAPEEIASAVLWLCGPGSTYVIGHALVVDGGYTIH